MRPNGQQLPCHVLVQHKCIDSDPRYTGSDTVPRFRSAFSHGRGNWRTLLSASWKQPWSWVWLGSKHRGLLPLVAPKAGFKWTIICGFYSQFSSEEHQERMGSQQVIFTSWLCRYRPGKNAMDIHNPKGSQIALDLNNLISKREEGPMQVAWK